MITNAPYILPNSRIQSDNGRITISSTMIGVTNGTGFAKCLTQCSTPFPRIPATSTRIILITASAIVTFMSFVGGLNPNSPITFECKINRYRSSDMGYNIFLPLRAALRKIHKIFRYILPETTASFPDSPRSISASGKSMPL